MVRERMVHIERDSMKRNSYAKMVQELQRSSQTPMDQSMVGSLIKRTRIAKGQTQYDVAKGICSVSYLSKIENGQYGKDNLFVQEILQKMEVSLTPLADLDFQHLQRQAIQAFVNQDYDVIQGIRARFETPIHPSEWILELISLLSQQEEVEGVFEYLDQNRRVLSPLELSIFLTLYVLHAVNEFRLRDAEYMIDLLEGLPDIIPAIGILIHWVWGRFYTLNGEYSAALLHLNLLLTEYTTTITDRLRLDVHYQYLLIFSWTHKPKPAAKILSTIEQLGGRSTYHHYTMGFYYLMLQQYEDAVKEFLSAKEDFLELSLLGVIESYFRAGDKAKLKDYRAILIELQPGLFYEHIAGLFVLVSQQELAPLKDFITHVLQPMFIHKSIHYYKRFAIESLQEYYRGISRYKQVDLLRGKL
jgi:transcriptional regulator with XRE-family HTH domain